MDPRGAAGRDIRHQARTIGRALKRLEAEGVLILEGNEVWASPCALHMDGLGMVSI
jgi:hypothetical protein